MDRPESEPQPLVLVVEDDWGLSQLIQRLLKQHGLRSVAAQSGSQAVAWLLENHADLMLLDYSLPDMRADRLIELLEARGCKIPFIVATGHGSETIAVEMMKRGARDYLVKGLSFLELLAPQVNRVLAQVEKEQRLARAEQALRESEERLRTVIEASNAGIWDWDLVHKVGYWSDEIYALTGVSRDSAPVDLPTIFRCIHPDDLELVRETFGHMQPGKPTRLEFRLVRPDGECHWVALSGKSLADAEGRPVRVTGSVFDITDRKRAEIALEAGLRQQAAVAELGRRALEGEEFNRLLDDVVGITAETLEVDYAVVLELLPDDQVRIRTSAGSYVEATDRGAAGCGPALQARETLAGGESIIVADYARDMRCGESAPTGELTSGLTVLIHGRVRPFGVLAAHTVKQRLFTRDDRHFLQAVANVLADVIDRNRAEEEARQRQSELAHVMRLNTMGKMVSELAHEINQPLYAIANYAGACREVMQSQAVELPEEMRHWMQQISDQANRAGEILRRLGEFVRKDALLRSATSLSCLIRNVMALVEIDARVNEVQLQLELDDAAADVVVDRVQIEQVIVNLVLNAIQAMDQAEAHRRKVTIRTRVTQEQVHVEVQDAGQGVDDDQFLHLFDAFFTTKPTGMGMGLPISRSIIEAHDGELQAARNAGPGMTFRFWLPLAQGEHLHAN